MNSRHIPKMFALGLAALVLLAIACTQSNDDKAIQSDELRFSVSMDDGFFYEVSGDKAGYAPNQPATFVISMQNPNSGEVDVSYCALLVHRNGPIEKVGEADYTVSGNSTLDEQFKVTIPDGLEDGSYALAFVIPETNAVVNNIWIGELGEEQDLGWTAPLNLTGHSLCAAA